MSEGKTYEHNWKSKYIEWYRYLESVFQDLVPHLTDDEIMGYVSDKDWIIIPITGEADKRDARLADRPNLFFDLSDGSRISLGISYDKLGSVRRLRNILSPFNAQELNQTIQQLQSLNDSFLTKGLRKTKSFYWAEAPTYEDAFVQYSNKMDHKQFQELIQAIDEILNERRLLDEGKKYQLAPSVDLVYSEVTMNENEFKGKLLKIKPIYEVAIKVRTEGEFEEECRQQKKKEEQKKQETFRRYVEELRDKRSKNLISAEEYRRLIMQSERAERSIDRNTSLPCLQLDYFAFFLN